MIRRLVLGAVATTVLIIGLAACGREAENGTAAEVNETAPTLSVQASVAAITLIQGDLNAPILALQNQLRQASLDGVIRTDELVLSTPESFVPIDWWAWNKGYLQVVDDPSYGRYLDLSDAGRQFLALDLTNSLGARAVGTPTMECRSAGTATSAACKAVVTYEVVPERGALIGAGQIPNASAHLEAAFAPGAGWSVQSLVADDQTPAALVTAAILGDADAQAAGRERFEQGLRARLAQLDAATIPPVEETESATPSREVQAAQPSLSRDASTAKPRTQPAAVVEPTYRRRPSAAELRGLYPPQMLARGVAGQSIMTCTVTVSGSITDCQSEAESPAGSRFGRAGTEAARFFQMTPRTVRGEAVASTVRLSIDWNP
jgi:TonB family protein